MPTIGRDGRTRRLQRFYGAVHRLYDPFMFESTQEIWEAELALLRPAPGERALDVGCGTGRLAIALADLVGESGSVLALDISPAMLRQAAREVARTALAKRIRLLQGDARALPCADQSFDLAAAGLVLELLCPADLDRALGELRRAVRPGGRIVLAALADEEPYSRPLSFYLVLRRIIPLAALGAPLKLRQAAARAGLAPRISVRRGLLRLPVDILLCDLPARDA